jgi:guanosine-3',5'-bis(diphosphate) 3'-pyrophosphohydrolase
MMANLEDAILLASVAHRGQKDKAGAPYILHPLRVMFHLENHADDATRIAAVLHDVIEDTPVSAEQLRERGFANEAVEAVEFLTKLPEEENDYEAFINRAAKNPIARRVKIADLKDNMDESRIASPTEKDRKRMEKYRRALETLTS